MGKFDYEPVGLLDSTHLRFFTVRTARRMIEEAGYRIVRFHPVFGDRTITRCFRPLWQKLTNWLPNLLAFQLIFLVEPASGPLPGRPRENSSP